MASVALPLPAKNPVNRMGVSDCHRCGPLMKHLANKQFVTDTNIKQAVSLLCQNTGLGTTMLKWQG